MLDQAADLGGRVGKLLFVVGQELPGVVVFLLGLVNLPGDVALSLFQALGDRLPGVLGENPQCDEEDDDRPERKPRIERKNRVQLGGRIIFSFFAASPRHSAASALDAVRRAVTLTDKGQKQHCLREPVVSSWLVLPITNGRRRLLAEEEVQEANNQGEERQAFDQRRGDDHRRLHGCRHFGLPGDAFAGRSTDLADADARSQDREAGTERWQDRNRRGNWMGPPAAAAGAGAAPVPAGCAKAGIASTTATRKSEANVILVVLSTEIISSGKMVVTACPCGLVRVGRHANEQG